MKNGYKTRLSVPPMRGNAAKPPSGAILRTRSGVSLLISIVLISIVMVFAIGISNLVTSSLRQTSNVNRSTQAFYAAEGALESGLLENQTKGAGYTLDTRAVTLCETGQNCPTANVTIQGTVKNAVKYLYSGPYNNHYGMPTPGTGTVGSNCSPLTAYYDKVFIFPEGSNTTYAPWEHPCNWNKLKVGESAAIPLYTVTDDSGSTNCPMDSYLGYRVCNPVNLGLTSLVLRVRTPCKDGSEFCSASERYDLNNSPSAGDPNVNGDDTILAWQITGTSIDHKTTYTLKPITELKPIENKRQPYNTEISEGRINGALTSTTNPFTVLPYPILPFGSADGGADLIGTKGKIISFLNNNNGIPGVFYRTDNNVINQPILKLTLVHSLDEWVSAGNGGSIPYLEYQLLTNSSTLPPADTSQTITAEGVSGTFKQVLEVKQPQETGLLEYVIQQ